MYKTFLLVLSALCLPLLLTGCGTGQSVNTDTPQEMTSTGTLKATGVPVCDQYLTVLQCISQNATGTAQINFNSSYESLVQSFQNVPATQLTQTCTTLTDALRSHPTLLKDYSKCNML